MVFNQNSSVYTVLEYRRDGLIVMDGRMDKGSMLNHVSNIGCHGHAIVWISLLVQYFLDFLKIEKNKTVIVNFNSTRLDR